MNSSISFHEHFHGFKNKQLFKARDQTSRVFLLNDHGAMFSWKLFSLVDHTTIVTFISV